MAQFGRRSGGLWGAMVLAVTFAGATLGGAAIEFVTSNGTADATQRTISSDAVLLTG